MEWLRGAIRSLKEAKEPVRRPQRLLRRPKWSVGIVKGEFPQAKGL